SPEWVAETSRNLAYVHRDEACDTSGWNLGTLLRVPSPRNNKPGLDQPFTVTAHSDGTMYTSEDILDAYPQDGSAPLKVHTGSMPKIGRASCRERVQGWIGAFQATNRSLQSVK